MTTPRRTAKADKVMKLPPAQFHARGRTGLNALAGTVHDEWLRELQGERGRKIYREMWDNDPVIGSIRWAMELFAKRASWRFETEGQSAADEQAVAFVESNWKDMERPASMIVTNALSMVPYGWGWQEILYKVRTGPDTEDPRQRSRYTDGLVGWRDFADRSQDSNLRWVFAGEAPPGDLALLGLPPGAGAELTRGQVLGWIQRSLPDHNELGIPRWKSLHYRPRAPRDNPEGLSLLRNAYRPWFFKKRLEEAEGIGHERDLVGVPVFEVPPELFVVNDPDAEAMLTRIMEMGANLRVDAETSIILPNEKAGYKVSLLASGGAKAMDVGRTIDRYDGRIAMTFLGDFVLLGQRGDRGSWALADSKTNLFMLGMAGLFQVIADEINDRAIPLLFQVNQGRPGFPQPTVYPRLVVGDVESPDLVALGGYLSQLAAAGFANIIADERVEDYARAAAHLPPRIEGAERVTPADLAGAGAAEEEVEDEEPATTPAAKAAVWKAEDTRRNHLERRLLPVIRTELARQYGAVAKAVRVQQPQDAGQVPALVRAALDRVASTATLTAAVTRALAPGMALAAERGRQRAAKILARKAAEPEPGADFTTDVARYLHSKALKGRLARITARSEERLRTTLTQGIEAGDTMGELAERVNRALELDNVGRAGMIARTEALGAMNAATTMGYAAAGASAKEWVATKDSRTREDHADADGQVVPITDAFDVGGEQLAYPGDPNGSAENVINCRCTTVPAALPGGGE